jgi:hypothetical protein
VGKYTWNPELAAKIILAIATEGKTLKAACEALNLPTDVFWYWFSRDYSLCERMLDPEAQAQEESHLSAKPTGPTNTSNTSYASNRDELTYSFSSSKLLDSEQQSSKTNSPELQTLEHLSTEQQSRTAEPRAAQKIPISRAYERAKSIRAHIVAERIEEEMQQTAEEIEDKTIDPRERELRIRFQQVAWRARAHLISKDNSRAYGDHVDIDVSVDTPDQVRDQAWQARQARIASHPPAALIDTTIIDAVNQARELNR